MRFCVLFPTLAAVLATQTDLAGTCGASAGTADGVGGAAAFNAPRSVAIGPDGTIYISDAGSHTIRMISGTTVSTIAGQAGTSGSADGTGTAATLDSPTDLVVLGNILYIADQGNGLIRQMDLTTMAISTIAGTAGVSGFADGTGPAASFENPIGLALSPDNTELFIVDYSENVRRMVLSTAVVTTLAGVGNSDGHVDNSGTLARFHSPFDACHAPSGATMYVSDGDNHVIRQIDTVTGAVTTIAGSPGQSGTTDAADGASARFNSPRGLALSYDGGTLYVADRDNNAIRIVDLSTGAGGTQTFAVSTLATTGLSMPIGLALRTDGNLLIVDMGSNCVRQILTASIAPSPSPLPSPPPPSPSPPPPSASPSPPSSSSPNGDGDDPCFPSSAKIVKADGTLASIDALKEGDAIVAVTMEGALTTDTVSLLSIAKPEARDVAFLTLTTADGRNLTLTPGHHLPTGASCCAHLKQAGMLQVGETVWVVQADELVARVVTMVAPTVAAGLHSPVLSSGSLPVVDGVVTSFDAIEKVTLAKYGLAPLVAACKATGTCESMRHLFLSSDDRQYIA